MKCNRTGALELDFKKTHGMYIGNLWRDANFQSIRSLKNEDLFTFEDELKSLFDTFRSIYGPLPWNEPAKRFNDGDFSVLDKIEELRNETNLVVS